jgi:hypothetical protein
LTYPAGQGCGFDIDLVKMVSDAVTIPVIASSGAGAVQHFSEIFEKTNASAALAAGIFHRKEVLMFILLSFLSQCYAIDYFLRFFLSSNLHVSYLISENFKFLA